MSKRKAAPAIRLEDVGMAVYDGQTFKGSVLVPRAFAAYAASGELVGTFRTLIAASRAIRGDKEVH